MLASLLQKLMVFALHLDNPNLFPEPLTAKEEKAYIEKMMQGDRNARETLIERNLRLVAHLVKKYYAANIETDELISIGDYILTGGELPAMVLLDSVTRLTKGALREESTREESFENGLLEYPQYTRPAVFDGKAVPEVLLSGNHEAIRRWRREESEKFTRRLRPDLVYPLEQ